MDLKNNKTTSAYTVRLAEMSYLTGKRPEKAFSFTLIRELITERYFSEARYAIDHLLKTYGPDAGLYYLEAVCYRNQHEYTLAGDEIQKALDLENQNSTYQAELQNIRDEKTRWMTVDSLNAFNIQG